MADLRGNGLLKVDVKPTNTPDASEAHLARLNETLTFYYYDGTQWVTVKLDAPETYTGNIIPDNANTGQALQALETAFEALTLDGNNTPITRGDAVEDVEPTAGEVATPISGDTADVFLTGGKLEKWVFGTAWTKAFTLDYAEVDTLQSTTDRGNSTTNDIVIDPNGTSTNIAGSQLTIKNSTTGTGTNVGGEFIDVQRSGAVTNTGETIASVIRTVHNSSGYHEGIIGLNGIGRYSGSGGAGYIYAGLIKADYQGSGDVDFLIPFSQSANITGTGAGTIDYARGGGGSVIVNNPNVTVNFAQGGHPNVTLEQGTVGTSQVMFLDYDFNTANLGTTLNLTGDFTYLQGGGGGDVAAAKAHIEANGNKARFIWNQGDWESDFGGLINVSQPVTAYSTATPDALVPVKYLEQELAAIEHEGYSESGTVAGSDLIVNLGDPANPALVVDLDNEMVRIEDYAFRVQNHNLTVDNGVIIMQGLTGASALQLRNTAATQNNYQEFQDKSGTIALLSDLAKPPVHTSRVAAIAALGADKQFVYSAANSDGAIEGTVAWT